MIGRENMREGNQNFLLVHQLPQPPVDIFDEITHILNVDVREI